MTQISVETHADCIPCNLMMNWRVNALNQHSLIP